MSALHSRTVPKPKPGTAPPEALRLKPLTLRGNFAWTTCGSVVYSLCSWLMLSAIAKLGSPAMVGEFTLGLAVAQPVMVFSQLSLNQAQATDARGDYQFGDYLGLRLITNLAAMSILAVLAVLGGYTREAGVIVVLAGVGLAFDGVGDIVCGLLRRHERMDRVAISQAATGILSLLLLSGGLRFLHSLVWAAGGSALASALVVIFYDIPNAVTLLRRSEERAASLLQRLPRPHSDLRVLGRLAWTAMPLGVIMVLLSVNNNLSRYFVAHSLGLGELGIFSALASFVTVGRLVTTALGLSASPRMARYYAAGDRDAFVRLQRRLFVISAAVGAAAPVAAAAAGRPLLTFFYTPEYARHLDVFVLCLAAGGLSYVDGSIGWAITAARAFKAQAVSLAALTLVVAGSSAWLIPRYGLRGAAWAAVVVSVAQLVINSVILRYVLRVLPKSGASGVAGEAKPTEPSLNAQTALKTQTAQDFRRYRREGTRLGLHVLLFCPGFRVTLTHRILNRLQWNAPGGRSAKLTSLLLNQVCHAVSETTALATRILLPPSCQIGTGLFIPHFGPVTVHPGAVIGENCTLHQGVVIGQAGRGERKGVPALGNRVYIGANAVLIGEITLGDDVAVGAGAVVTKSVPSRAVVAGNPARIISYSGSFDLIFYDGMDTDAQRLASLAAGADEETLA